jgi:hypothetical protein
MNHSSNQLTDSDYTLLSNTLSNLYSWTSNDLEQDFIYFILSEIPMLPEPRIRKLFKDYSSLSPLERNSAHFDIRSFIEQSLYIL